MWVVFRKSDGTVVGTSSDSEIDIEKEKALAEVVSGLQAPLPLIDYDAAQITTRGTLESLGESAARGLMKVVPDKTGGMDLFEKPAAVSGPSEVVVTTSATEFHPVDSVPLLRGDGQSFLVVTLQKVSQVVDTSVASKTVEAAMAIIGGIESPPPDGGDKEADDEIWLRPSHGSVREDNDTRTEIRSVKLVNGTARFRFYSDTAKRLANVQMLSANPNLILDVLRVEFT